MCYLYSETDNSGLLLPWHIAGKIQMQLVKIKFVHKNMTRHLYLTLSPIEAVESRQ